MAGLLATCYHSQITCTLYYYIRITCILGSRLKAESEARLKCFEIFVASAGTIKYVDELEQKLNKRILPPEPVPSSKEDVDELANKVHSVVTKSFIKLLALCKSRFVKKITFGGILS